MSLQTAIDYIRTRLSDLDSLPQTQPVQIAHTTLQALVLELGDLADAEDATVRVKRESICTFVKRKTDHLGYPGGPMHPKDVLTNRQAM